MKSIQALRERRNALAKELNDLLEKNPGDKWKTDASNQEKYDAGMRELDDIDDEMKRIKDVQARLANQASEEDLRDRHTRTPGAHQADKEESNALRAFLAGGLGALSEDAIKRLRNRQTPDIRNAMSTTTTTEGGYTVATEYMRELEIAMKLYGGMRAVSRGIRTASGATMNFPTADATAEVGEIVGQNTAVTGLDTAFGNVSLDVYKYSSKKIALPFELIQDSFLDIEAYVRDVLAMRLGRIQNTHFTTGDGSSKPYGVVTGAASGKTGTTGQTATVIYADLVDLEHSVDPAYRASGNCRYMMHDSSLKVIRKVLDSQNRPVFVPGYETGNPGGAPDRLLGREIVINQDVATMAANAKSILFGLFDKYIIRDVMDLTLFRMTDSAFTLNGQVGFVGFMRSGGRLVDAGGAVKYYANSAT